MSTSPQSAVFADDSLSTPAWKQEVNARLAEVMATAFKKVMDVQSRYRCGMKTAALIPEE